MGLTVLGRIASYASAGLDPATMGMGPVPASRRALERRSSNSPWDPLSGWDAGASFGGVWPKEVPIRQRRAKVRGIDPGPILKSAFRFAAAMATKVPKLSRWGY